MCRSFEGIDEAFGAGAAGAIVALDSAVPANPVSDVSSIAPLAASGLKGHDFYLLQRYFDITK